ncbi:MAG: hypothetical protein N3D75_04260 [Candidatus Aenigmarchaeota archaeon]|nr:hypothetical protein [Candidatus Aenigmarchaeota archaeon]
MRLVAFLIIFLSLVVASAKVIEINGNVVDFFTGKPVDGSFVVLSKEVPTNSVKGDVLGGSWSTFFSYDEQTKNILIRTNTSEKLAYSIISLEKSEKKECKNVGILLKINVFNQSAIFMKASIEKTQYTNINLIPNQENLLNVCLAEGVYRIKVNANDISNKTGQISFFYVVT